MRSFFYTFEELPLVTLPGVEAGLINGQVEVCYTNPGMWSIRPDTIAIEGYRKLTQTERDQRVKPWVYVQAPEAISSIILARLLGDWRDHISNAIVDQMEAA